MGSTPPRPRPALSVGVTGHRLNRLPEEGRDNVVATIAELLEGIASAAGDAAGAYAASFSEKAPRLALVSSLAEGTDRIAAEAALARGFLLEAPLPFPAEVYETDFVNDGSLEAFRTLVGRAEGVLTLPGRREAESQAYAAAGLAMLDHSDLLIAVWDGQPAEGYGGTLFAIDEAVRRGMPVVIVDAGGVAPPTVRWPALEDAPEGAPLADLPSRPAREALPDVVDRVLRPPCRLGVPDERERAHLSQYYRERRHAWNRRLSYPALMALLRVRPMRRTDVRPNPPEATAEGVPQDLRSAAPDLAAAYGWADSLAVYFAQMFRSAIVLNFTAAALAVFTVALSILAKDTLHLVPVKWPFVTFEVLFLLAVILNTRAGRRRDWQRRWLEPREIAEHLRFAPVLRLLGERPAIGAGDVPTWTTWYVRALVRASGLPGIDLDAGDLARARTALAALVDDQRAYNEASAERMHRMDHRLERTGAALFIATLAVAIGFLAARAFGVEPPKEATAAVTALTAGLPALATATYGIRQLLDLGGFAERSGRTAAELTALSGQIAANEPSQLPLLKTQARRAADIVQGDLATWRTAAASRGLEVPG